MRVITLPMSCLITATSKSDLDMSLNCLVGDRCGWEYPTGCVVVKVCTTKERETDMSNSNMYVKYGVDRKLWEAVEAVVVGLNDEQLMDECRAVQRHQHTVGQDIFPQAAAYILFAEFAKRNNMEVDVPVIRPRNEYLVLKQDFNVSKGKLFNVTYVRKSKGRTVRLERPIIRTHFSGKGSMGQVVDFDADMYFLGHEISPYLNRKMGNTAWGDLVTDDPDFLVQILQEGWQHPDTGQMWRALFSNWRDRAGKVILVPEDSHIKTLADIGVYTKLKVITESMKAAKYINRMFAPVDEGHNPVWGKEVEGSWIAETGEFLVQLERGETIIVKLIELDSMTDEEKGASDGHLSLNTRAHRLLGLSNNPKIGDSYRVSMPCERGVGKGHTQYDPNQVPDIVVYGIKKQAYASEFCFMSLGPLHTGNPHTDVQSITNFKLSELVYRRVAIPFMKLIYRNAHTAQSLFSLLAQTLRHDDKDPDIDDELVTDITNAWGLRRLMMAAINPFTFPGTYRRVVRHFMQAVMRCAEFRIPLNFEPSVAVATSAYASGDPFAKNEDGSINMDLSEIGEGQCVNFSLPDMAEVIVHRQPNENAMAFYRLVNIHHADSCSFRRKEHSKKCASNKLVPKPCDCNMGKCDCLLNKRFKESKGSALIFLGRGVHKLMSRLGGGDMDDNLIIYFDQEFVRHFDNMYYPETDKLVPIEGGLDSFDADLGDLSVFDEEVFTGVMDVRAMIHQISKSSGRDVVGIGPVVNVGMIDDLLSNPDNLPTMLQSLEEQGADPFFANWLTNQVNFDPNVDPEDIEDVRIRYSSAFLMTNLEIVIDAAVKDPGLLSAMTEEAKKFGAKNVSDFISKFHAHTYCYPKSMTLGRNRIPEKRREKGGYVLVLTPQCLIQQKLIRATELILQACKRNEWKLAKKADPVISGLLPPADDRINLLVYPRRDEDGKIIPGTGIRGWWKQRWAEYSQMVNANSENSNPEIYQVICQELAEKLDRLPKGEVEAVALELYRSVYLNDNPDVQFDELSGGVRPFPDGLLWTSYLSNSFINLLARNGLTGQFRAVKLYTEHHLASRPGVKVQLKEGIVYHNGNPVGVIKAANQTGIQTMNYGLIRFKRADDSLQPKHTQVELSNAIIDISKPVQDWE